MQRIRMSLPYFEEFGWEAEVVTVDLRFSDMPTDNLLLKSVPAHIPVHYVKALSKLWTSKIGLGSIALRSLPFFRTYVNKLLKKKKFDLVYFSTTQFPVCILGPYWKRKFGIPYVIDMQDPWHSDYYQNKLRNQRPRKYWLSYRLDKALEPLAMKRVDGLIAVSEAYLKTLQERYINIRTIPQQTITFGAFGPDFKIAEENQTICPSFLSKNGHQVKVVYIGRGGNDMADAISYLFTAFKKGLQSDVAQFSRLHFFFIGTSYAASGKGALTIAPIAASMNISNHVTEIADRIPFYQTLNTLKDADGLFVPGSNDSQYTASKIYPYVFAGKPLLAIFHPASSVVNFLRTSNAGVIVTFEDGKEKIIEKSKDFLYDLLAQNNQKFVVNEEILNLHSARTMTAKQVELFNEVTA